MAHSRQRRSSLYLLPQGRFGPLALSDVTQQPAQAHYLTSGVAHGGNRQASIKGRTTRGLHADFSLLYLACHKQPVQAGIEGLSLCLGQEDEERFADEKGLRDVEQGCGGAIGLLDGS